MSLQGKQFSPDMIEMVVHLKNHFDEERKSQELVYRPRTLLGVLLLV